MNEKVEMNRGKIRVHFKLLPVGGHRPRRAGLNKDVAFYENSVTTGKETHVY